MNLKKLMIIMLIVKANFVYAQEEFSVPWAMFHGCEKHCGIYPAKEYKNFGDVKWKFKTEGKVFSSPAVFNGVAYIGSEDKCLYAIDVNTGNLKWKFQTNGAVHSSPSVYKNTVYFGSYDGYYYAVDAVTGKEKWKFKTGGEKKIGSIGLWGMKPSDQYMDDEYDFFLSSPILDMEDEDLTLYFGSSDGNLYALNAEKGTLKWKFKTNGIIHSSPALYNSKVYIGSWDTFLYAIDAKTGIEKWKFKTGSDPQSHLLEGIQASPMWHDGKVYIGARDGNFYALNDETGEPVWKYSANSSWILTTAAAKDGVVYLGTSDSFLFLALDAKTGKEKYSMKTDGYVYSSPALVGNTAYFGDFTGKMYALDLTSNGQSWNTFQTDGRKLHVTKVLNKEGKLDFMHLAGKKDPAFYATGEEVMKEMYTLGPIVSSPVIKEGVIYFGSADGCLYAVNLKN